MSVVAVAAALAVAPSAGAAPQTKYYTATVGSSAASLSSSVLYPVSTTGETLVMRLANSPSSNQYFGSADIDLVNNWNFSHLQISTAPDTSLASAWSAVSSIDANGHVIHLRNNAISTQAAIPPGGSVQIQLQFDTPPTGAVVSPVLLVKQSNDFSDSSITGKSNVFTGLAPAPAIYIGTGAPAKLVYLQGPSDVQVTTSSGTHYMCPAVRAAVEDVDNHVVTWLPATAVTLSSTGSPGLKLDGSTTLRANTSAGVAVFGNGACTAGLTAANQGTFDLKATAAIAAGPGYSASTLVTASPQPTFTVYLTLCGASCDVSLNGNQTGADINATGGDGSLTPVVGFISTAVFASGCDSSISYRPEQTTLDLEGHDKTVTVAWSKKVTNLDPRNGTPFWPVCLQAPYGVYVENADGSVSLQDASNGAMLAPCSAPGVGLRADGKPDAPCILDLYKNAGSEHAVIWLPNLPGDPHLW